MALPHFPDELERAAKERMSPAAYSFFAYGCGMEQSLEENVLAWRRWYLRPRVLRSTEGLETTTTVCGTQISFPVLLAPCGFNRLAHDEGELAVARAAETAGTIQVLSSTTSVELERVAKETGTPKWFQLYCGDKARITDERVDRAAAAGFQALVVTVDTSFLGLRYKGLADIPAFLAELQRLEVEGAHYQTPRLDWAEIERIKSRVEIPVILKGIVHPDDARLAAEAGVDAVIVSNHGARQLDGTIPPAFAVPDIVEAAPNLEIYVDGGIRSGSDVLRALALGARAVLIGRPYLWALAIDGESGVRELLDRLKLEVRNAMALAGQTDPTQVDRDIVVRAAGASA